MADDFTLLDVRVLERFKGEGHTMLDTFTGKLFHHATYRKYILHVTYNRTDYLSDTKYLIRLYNGKGKRIGTGSYKTNDTIVFDELNIPLAIKEYKNRLLGDIEQFIFDILI